MHYVKLTKQQKTTRLWCFRRNALVGKLLAADPKLPRIEALRMANKKMRNQ